MFIKLFFAFILAFFLGGLQYLYKKKDYKLFIIRSLVYFLIFLLWINPQIKQEKKQTYLPDLFVLTDQSQSIAYKDQTKQVEQIIQSIKNSDLNRKFNIRFLGFHTETFPLDTLNFIGKRTDIAQALEKVQNIHSQKNTAPLILITDGNSNQGKDYVYSLKPDNHLQIFPIITGDTTHYENIRIDRINYNPSVYKGNTFPVEIFINYEGKHKPKAVLKIFDGKQLIHKKNINLKNNFSVEHLKIKATKPGIHHYTAVINNLPDEKNTTDNRKVFSVEVIDQSKKIALITSIIHPDIGAIKRMLKKNKYYQIDLIDTHSATQNIEKYDALILYQPTANFEKFFKRKKLSTYNWFMITGTQTDWNWLNNQNLFFKKNKSQATEEYFPVPNNDFNLFKLPELSFEKLPPLKDIYGKLEAKNAEIALYAKVKNIKTHQGLLSINTQPKQVLLLGENIWQWYLIAGKNAQQEQLSELVQKIIQYIGLNRKFNKIQLYYDKTYYNGENIKITTKILNENLENDLKAQPVLSLFYNKKLIKKTPMALSDTSFKIDIEYLPPGEYFFKINDKISGTKTYGSFVVLASSPETGNNRANMESLKAISDKTNGKLYFSDNYKELLNDLSNAKKYPSHFKIFPKKMPLIAYKYLLFAIVFLLSIEWFIKKLQGSL